MSWRVASFGAVVLALAACASQTSVSPALTEGDKKSGVASVTVAIDSLRSDEGRVTGSLCNDPAAGFCSTYIARTVASGRQAQLRFEGVAPGRYFLSTVHDVNGNGRTEVPPEGAAFGNNSTLPLFETAAILVEGNMTTSVSMTYPGSGPPRMGSKGAPPPEGIARIDVRENGLYGELYLPKDPRGKLPTVILLDGSNGGLDGVSILATGFAREGYAALALAYFAETGLPETLEGVPLEYFDTAVAWLQGRSEIDRDAVGVLGVSRGAEAALLLAARNPAVHAVIVVGPSNVVWQGYDRADPGNGDAPFTAGGKPLPFLRPDLSLYVPNTRTNPLFESALDKAGDRPEAEIAVERINGPILLIAGENDEVWPSPNMARRIVSRLSRSDFAHKVDNVVLPGSHYVFTNGAAPMRRAIDFLDVTLKSDAR